MQEWQLERGDQFPRMDADARDLPDLSLKRAAPRCHLSDLRDPQVPGNNFGNFLPCQVKLSEGIGK